MTQIHVKFDFADGVLTTVIKEIQNVSALDCQNNGNISVKGELITASSDALGQTWTTKAAVPKDNRVVFRDEEFHDKVDDVKSQTLRLTVLSELINNSNQTILGHVLVSLTVLHNNNESEHCFHLVKGDDGTKPETEDKAATTEQFIRDRVNDVHHSDEEPERQLINIPDEQPQPKEAYKETETKQEEPDQEVKKTGAVPTTIERYAISDEWPKEPQPVVPPRPNSDIGTSLIRPDTSSRNPMGTPLAFLGNLPVMRYLPRDSLINLLSIYRSDLPQYFMRSNPPRKKKKKKARRLAPVDPGPTERCHSVPNLRLPLQPEETRRRRELRFDLERADTFADIREGMYERHKGKHRNLGVAYLHPAKGIYLPGLVYGPPRNKGERSIHYVAMGNGEKTKIRVDSGKHFNPIGGAVPWPILRVGDYVLVKQSKEDWSASEYYNPGVVIRQRLGTAYGYKFYTILLHSNEKVEADRRNMLLISYRRYMEAVNEIREKTLYRHVSNGSTRHLGSSGSVRLSGSAHSIRNMGSAGSSRLQGSVDYVHQPESARSDRRRDALNPRQEVLARWPEDGWFYYAVVVAATGSDVYKVKDALGNVTSLHRDNIFTDTRYAHTVKVGNFVIGPHPRYRRSFAPAEVISKNKQNVELLFFDGVTEATTVNYVYKISTDTSQTVKDFIHKCEEKYLSGKSVVFDKSSKCFTIREIRNKKELQQLIYPLVNLVDWRRPSELPENREHRQMTQHIFPLSDIGLRNRRPEDWRYALGPANKTSAVYLPAKVKLARGRSPEHNDDVDDGDVILSFCNGKTSSRISLHECFYLSRDYYNLTSGVCAEYRA